MSITRRRTLAEAHLALEAMIDDVATLLEVVADDDLPDAYDDYTLESMFTKQLAERFATQLVYRILHDDDFILEWRGSEEERRRRDREKHGGSEGPEDEDDTTPMIVAVPDAMEYERQRRIEHATSLRTGDMVRRIGRKPRGVVSGRNADDPTMLQVRWYGVGGTEWVNAEALEATGPGRPITLDETTGPTPETYAEADDMPVEVDEAPVATTREKPKK